MTRLFVIKVHILVFVLILGTVAPALVLAEDSVSITNSVHSSTNTGGQSGSNGTDGAAGRDGASGSSVSTQAAEGTASVNVQTTNDGVVITDVTKTTTGTAAVVEVSTDTNTSSRSTYSSGDTVSTAELTVDAQPTESNKAASPLEQLIDTLQIFISQYVSILF